MSKLQKKEADWRRWKKKERSADKGERERSALLNVLRGTTFRKKRHILRISFDIYFGYHLTLRFRTASFSLFCVRFLWVV
jgi:hypothetical protein